MRAPKLSNSIFSVMFLVLIVTSCVAMETVFPDIFQLFFFTQMSRVLSEIKRIFISVILIELFISVCKKEVNRYQTLQEIKQIALIQLLSKAAIFEQIKPRTNYISLKIKNIKFLKNQSEIESLNIFLVFKFYNIIKLF